MITAHYGSDEFHDLVVEVVATVKAEGHVCIVLLGGGSEARQSVVSALAEYSSLDVVQRDMSGLIAGRPLQTQGNLREAFDNAGDAPILLVFEDADALFDAERREVEEGELDQDARTLADYLYDRIDHIAGITVLHLADATHLERAKEIADVVVKL